MLSRELNYLEIIQDKQKKHEKEIQELKRLDLDRILLTVCMYYNFPVKRIKSKTRDRSVSRIRQIALYVAHKSRKSIYSIKDISRMIANRDHATLIHAIKTIEGEMQSYPKFREEIAQLLSIV